MLVIGVLGGVASGKTAVTKCFEQEGCLRIDGDLIGHQVLEDSEIKRAVVDQWGSTVLDADGEVDRGKLAAIVFDAKTGNEQLARLEAITHPAIAQTIKQQINKARKEKWPAVVLDAAVMLKGGWDRQCDHLVFVDVPKPIRLQRAAKRGWSAEAFQRREAAQLPLSVKRTRADTIIDNSTNLAETARQVRNAWQRFLGNR